MSFSDFAGPSSRVSTNHNNNHNSSSSSRIATAATTSSTTNNNTSTLTNVVTTTSSSFGSESISNNNNNKSLMTISDALLQYQRNVGILEKIVQSLGTSSSSMNPSGTTTIRSSHWNETIAQYEAQNHVLQQLEEKLKSLLLLLQQQGTSSHHSTTTTTAMMKLQRDYERVQIRVQQLQDIATTKISSIQQQQQQQQQQQKSNSTIPFFLNQNHTTGSNNSNPMGGEENDTVLRQYQQQQLIQQQEDRLQEEIMREREEEIRNINRGMHTVNEIYKDLAHMVSQQQQDIDIIETQMDHAHTSAQQGLQQVEKANEKYGQGNCSIM